MLVLGIETSCDETACALVIDGKEIISETVASQILKQRRFKGVFPEIASREHIDALLPVIKETCSKGNISLSEIDLIAVAKGPGLIGSLLVGMNIGKTLSLCLNKPFIGVNHVEAHLYAPLMNDQKPLFPALGVVVSGGHTFLVKMEKLGSYECLGSTIDDAVGEAFDKVARLLGLPYPGGPEIERLALQGDSQKFPFKPGLLNKKTFNFSFSGLKTQVLYAFKDLKNPSEQDMRDIAASFQEVALKDIVHKTLKAAQTFECKSILLGGGVSCSRRLRNLFQEKNTSIPIFWPSTGLSMDNAAMIAGLGFHLFKNRGGDTLDLDVEPQNRLYSTPIT